VHARLVRADGAHACDRLVQLYLDGRTRAGFKSDQLAHRIPEYLLELHCELCDAYKWNSYPHGRVTDDYHLAADYQELFQVFLHVQRQQVVHLQLVERKVTHNFATRILKEELVRTVEYVSQQVFVLRT